jgi:hypothetical protein
MAIIFCTSGAKNKIQSCNHKDTRSYHGRSMYNADTGVGPAIASGNQVYNGICADLPQAPMNKQKSSN